MNAERLHRVSQLVLDELSETGARDAVQRLTSGLRDLAGSPTDAAAQDVIAEAREQLAVALPNAPSNTWPPSDRQIVDEIGIADVLGQALLDRINGVLGQNQMTPNVAAAEIEPIASRI